MGARRWNGNIEELPREILSLSLQAMTRSDLRDIGKRLSNGARDSSECVESWERLAERLGFAEADVDRLQDQAQGQGCCPGVLVLQEWGRRPGSTCYVLLHALREIQREDIVQVLVERLADVNTMLLYVSVEDNLGICQFLRVRPRRDAPLHASLDNALPADLYWYDITGPMPELDWWTPSGQLQGAQLTLKLRHEPCQYSKKQIYGFNPPGCQAPEGAPPRNPSPGRGSSEAQQMNVLSEKHVQQVKMSLAPVQPSVSVTVDLLDPHKLNVKAQGPTIRLVENDLSRERLSPMQWRNESTNQLPDNLQTGLGAPDAQLAVKSQPASTLSGSTKEKSSLYSLQPHWPDLGTLGSFAMDPRGGHHEMCGIALLTNPSPVNSMDISVTQLKECCLSSLTDAKQPMTGLCDASEEENKIEKINIAAVFERGGNPQGEQDLKAARACGRGSCPSSSAVCFMHPEYVLPKHVDQPDFKGDNVTHNRSADKEPQEPHRDPTELKKNSPLPAGQVRTECSNGESIPFACKSSASTSTLHPDYIPPGMVKQLCSAFCTYTSSGEHAMTELNIKVDSSRYIQKSSNVITVMNSYRRELGHESPPDRLQSSFSATQPSTHVTLPPHSCGCALHSVAGPPQTCGCPAPSSAGYVRLAQSPAGTAPPPACSAWQVPSSGRIPQSAAGVMDLGSGCGNTTHTQASVFSDASFVQCPDATACTGAQRTQSAVAAHMKQTSSVERTVQCSPTYVNLRSLTGQTAQASPTYQNQSPPDRHTVQPDTTYQNQPPHPRPRTLFKNQTHSRFAFEPGSSFPAQVSSAVWCDTTVHLSPEPPRGRLSPMSCEASTPEGPRQNPSPHRSEQRAEPLPRSASAPVCMDVEEPMQTSPPVQQKKRMNFSPRTASLQETHTSPVPAAARRKEKRTGKPLPCTYTRNIMPNMSSRFSPEEALPELSTISQPDSSILLMTSSGGVSIDGEQRNPGASLPRKKASGMEPPRADVRNPVSSGEVVFTLNQVKQLSQSEGDDDGYLYLNPAAHLEDNPANLSTLPGWNPSVTEKTVDREMANYVNEDGNFIVWFSPAKGQFVISVSYCRSAKHYWIHSTPELGRTEDGPRQFFLYKEGLRFDSLRALVEHCLRQGITEQPKTFMSPGGKREPRAKCRAVHVTLKTPVFAAAAAAVPRSS